MTTHIFIEGSTGDAVEVLDALMEAAGVQKVEHAGVQLDGHDGRLAYLLTMMEETEAHGLLHGAAAILHRRQGGRTEQDGPTIKGMEMLYMAAKAWIVTDETGLAAAYAELGKRWN